MIAIRVPRPLRLLSHDPFLSAGWRWAQAGRIIDAGVRATPPIADAAIRRAVAYRRALNQCRVDADHQRLAQRWPHLHQAHLIAEEGGLRRAELEAWILATLDDKHIADITGLEPETVSWFERLHFSVRDKFSAWAWVLVEAVGVVPGDIPNRDDLGGLWRSYAYFAGPIVLDAVISVTHPSPDRRRQLDPRIEVATRLSLAVHTARTEGELALLTALGRRLRRIMGQGDDLEKNEVLLRGLARMARNTVTGEAKQVGTPEEEAALASLDAETAAQIIDLTSAVERLEASVRVG